MYSKQFNEIQLTYLFWKNLILSLHFVSFCKKDAKFFLKLILIRLGSAENFILKKQKQLK